MVIADFIFCVSTLKVVLCKSVFSSCMMQILLLLPPSALLVTQMCCTVPNTDLYHFILDCRHHNINNVCNIGIRDETKCSVILVRL
jgi:hypothetical protein